METKIIFISDTDEPEKMVKLKDSMNAELVIIPKSMQIMIKDKEGYWSVVE